VLHVKYERVFNPLDPAVMVHIPLSEMDLDALSLVDAWPSRLADYGCDISTGPIVPFRARAAWLKKTSVLSEETVPLLWMNHVTVGAVTWPLGEDFRNEEHIRADAPTQLLMPNETFVLLRRFSAREQERRLTAAVYEGGSLPGESIGLENHLNFIHASHGGLPQELAYGLAGLLNSSLLERYFRVSAGNTQVNATQIRNLPLPDLETVKALGAALLVEPRAHDLDCVVERILGLR